MRSPGFRRGVTRLRAMRWVRSSAQAALGGPGVAQHVRQAVLPRQAYSARRPAAGRQLTQGMPFSVPTAPPCGPVVGMTGDDGLGVVVVAGPMVGTVVVSAPISTST